LIVTCNIILYLLFYTYYFILIILDKDAVPDDIILTGSISGKDDWERCKKYLAIPNLFKKAGYYY
jgi:hypothetical protein